MSGIFFAAPLFDKNDSGRIGNYPHVRVLVSPMRRYLVFTYYAGRPLGGYHDFLDSFTTLPEALANLLDEPNRYFQIVDRNSMKIVRQGLAAFKDYDAAKFRREDDLKDDPK